MRTQSHRGIEITKAGHIAKWSLIVAGLLLSWLAMMAVHETGHVVGAWISGGEVSGVFLHPLSISRTDLARNPHPLFVAWAGPIFGSIAPLAAFVCCRTLPSIIPRRAQRRPLPGTHCLRFFAGFCMIANGAYLSFGSIDLVGDAGELLRHGTPNWVLWAFGLLTMPAGLAFWHRLGPEFGLGPEGRAIGIREAITMWMLLVIVFGILLSLP